jgi:hypothetical protein
MTHHAKYTDKYKKYKNLEQMMSSFRIGRKVPLTPSKVHYLSYTTQRDHTIVIIGTLITQ